MDNMKKAIDDAKKIIENNKKYIFREELLSELKEGKTDVYLSTITSYTRQYLSNIFKARIIIYKETAIKILKPIFAESVKLKEKYEKYGMDKMVDYFFREI